MTSIPGLSMLGGSTFNENTGTYPTQPGGSPATPAPSNLSAPLNNPAPQNVLQQYQQLMQQPSGGTAPMQGGGANPGLVDFFNTPVAQLAYGTGPASQVANGGSYNPALAFASDPGVQMAMLQGQKAVGNNFAARGLGGQSGALASGLMDHAYNSYNNYVGTQANLFNNYQNQLANLTNLGAANTGNQNAYNSGTLLANLLAQANLGTAGQLSNANLGTGSNIAGLLANLGINNANIYENTAAAQANNIMQGNVFSGQMNASNNASNAASQSSLNNINAMNGQGLFGGTQAGGFTGGSF